MARNQKQPQDDDSPLGELEDQLYARKELTPARRSRLHAGEASEVSRDWEHKHHTPSPEYVMATARKKGKFVKWFLLFAVVFFIAAVGIAAAVIMRGGNVVSSRNVEVAVTGPVVVDAGDILEITVSVSNQNTTALETTDLIIEFAPGTRDPDDATKELPRAREPLGGLNPGALAKKNIRVAVFGETGDTQELIVSVEYRIAGSNAVFVKEKAFTYEIGHTPVTLRVEAPEEINAGQEFELEVSLESNSTETLTNILLTAEYPFGFSFINSAPRPVQGSRVWRFGDLPPGARRTVLIRGVIEGQDEEERTVRFAVGVADANGLGIATPFLSEAHTFALRRPFVEVNVALNGSVAEEITVGSGEAVRGDLSWRNNLSVPVSDVAIRVELSGDALNKSSVAVERGFYRSNSDTITWDEESDPRLGELSPGATGQVSFTFESLDLSERTDITNPEIVISITLSGRRVGESGSGSSIAATIGEKVVRIRSDIALTARAVHFVGPFENDGPMPPEAEEETTYTIIWSIANSSNDVDDVSVSATLPSYVQWVGQVSPSNESVSFSPVGGQVLWDAGAVPRGTGITGPPREVAFQILFVPSISQVGSIPTLINETRLSGDDGFTGVAVSDTEDALTTRLTTDPEFEEGQGRVVE
jgi:hypothetical protein